MPEIVMRFERIRCGSSGRETCRREGFICGVTRSPWCFTSNSHPCPQLSLETITSAKSTFALIVDVNSFADQVRRFVLRLVVSSDDHLGQKTHEHKLNPHREHDH